MQQGEHFAPGWERFLEEWDSQFWGDSPAVTPLPPTRAARSTQASRSGAAGAAQGPDASRTAQLSRSTYCPKGPWRQQLLPPLLPGARESTRRLPAAVRLPRASCSRCSCARAPSCAVSSAGSCTSSTGRTRSMAPAQPGEAALPGPGSAAIPARALPPAETPARPRACVTGMRGVLCLMTVT